MGVRREEMMVISGRGEGGEVEYFYRVSSSKRLLLWPQGISTQPKVSLTSYCNNEPNI